jgi:hypothetical protein
MPGVPDNKQKTSHNNHKTSQDITRHHNITTSQHHDCTHCSLQRIFTMAAAVTALEPMRKMEALFRPTTRYRDLNLEYEMEEQDLPEDSTEVELLPHVTLEDILATGITWEVLCLFLQNKLAWMKPIVIICAEDLVGNGAYGWLDWLVLVLGGDDETTMMMLIPGPG